MPNAPEPAQNAREERPRRVTIDPEGPLLVEGPVEVVGDDGRVIASRRFTAAICTCRRSRTYPWCDTSHRRRVKRDEKTPPGAEPGAGAGTRSTARTGKNHDQDSEGEEATDAR